MKVERNWIKEGHELCAFSESKSRLPGIAEAGVVCQSCQKIFLIQNLYSISNNNDEIIYCCDSNKCIQKFNHYLKEEKLFS